MQFIMMMTLVVLPLQKKAKLIQIKNKLLVYDIYPSYKSINTLNGQSSRNCKSCSVPYLLYQK